MYPFPPPPPHETENNSVNRQTATQVRAFRVRLAPRKTIPNVTPLSQAKYFLPPEGTGSTLLESTRFVVVIFRTLPTWAPVESMLIWLGVITQVAAGIAEEQPI